MSYAKASLLPDEKILYHTKPHYIIFYQFLMWLVFAFFAFEFIGSFLIGSTLLLVSVVSLVNSTILYFCSEYAITNKRILMKVGFIRRRSLEVFLDRVEGVYIDQTIIGRILNFGTVIINGVGGTKDPFFFIPKPLEFRSSVQQQMSLKGSSGGK